MGARIDMAVPVFDPAKLQKICDILADTKNGLTGSEIGRLLDQAGIEDPSPTITKRFRLFEALQLRQQRDRCGNHVLAFVQRAMDPVRYVDAMPLFEARRGHLNAALSFCGYQIAQDGRILLVDQARTLSEARQRADRLRIMLADRRVHGEVLRFCRAELVEDNYFHAVLEATKSVAERVRALSSLQVDGTELVDRAFCGLRPILAINSLQTETERSEQTGFANMLKGMFGTFRNVTAHAPKVKWHVSEEDALDLLAIVSYMQRRLDRSCLTGYAGSTSSTPRLATCSRADPSAVASEKSREAQGDKQG